MFCHGWKESPFPGVHALHGIASRLGILDSPDLVLRPGKGSIAYRLLAQNALTGELALAEECEWAHPSRRAHPPRTNRTSFLSAILSQTPEPSSTRSSVSAEKSARLSPSTDSREITVPPVIPASMRRSTIPAFMLSDAARRFARRIFAATGSFVRGAEKRWSVRISVISFPTSTPNRTGTRASPAGLAETFPSSWCALYAARTAAPPAFRSDAARSLSSVESQLSAF